MFIGAVGLGGTTYETQKKDQNAKRSRVFKSERIP